MDISHRISIRAHRGIECERMAYKGPEAFGRVSVRALLLAAYVRYPHGAEVRCVCASAHHGPFEHSDNTEVRSSSSGSNRDGFPETGHRGCSPRIFGSR